ncbi:MAG TPA: Co2+/Mg2+ efflux protein ApaG [Mariprofundaceae bacterium]|nr:Co2+/Mg2+ efflux protein ApaG [Mariprofundaceae bacterium]
MLDSSKYDIEVTAEPEYVPEHSEPEKGRYVFVYTIGIHNAGSVAAQLLSRHWIITDANGQVEEVVGDGVVGEQPVIQPGDEHEYSSFCELQTRVGYMEGSYTMRANDGTVFEAAIPAFTLAVPGSLN